MGDAVGDGSIPAPADENNEDEGVCTGDGVEPTVQMVLPMNRRVTKEKSMVR